MSLGAHPAGLGRMVRPDHQDATGRGQRSLDDLVEMTSPALSR